MFKFLLCCVLFLLVLNPESLARPQQSEPALRTATSVEKPITIGTSIQVESRFFDESRTIRIYLPESYSSGLSSYPVIYVLDGEVAFLHTASAAQFLAGNGLSPEIIVVAVHNLNRWRDMPVPDNYGNGGEEHFLDFLEQELIPLIDGEFRTESLRILIGHSQGGLFATYVMATRPDTFRWYVTIDPPLFGAASPLKQSVRDLIQRPDFHGRLISVERTLGWKDDWAYLEEVAPQTFVHDRFDIEGETHETMTFEGTYLALKRLFFDYVPDQIETKNLDTLLSEYRALSSAYGYTLPIPRRLLLRNIDDMLSQMRGQDAQEMLKYLTVQYGESTASQDLETRLQKVMAEGPLDETVDDILRSAPPSEAEIAPYLGTWDARINTPAPMVGSVTFQLENGRVSGTFQYRFAETQQLRELDIVVVRIGADGRFEWGYMNQMRPRGVIMNSGLLDKTDGTIRGTQEMKGVKMDFPPGFTPPVVTFQLSGRTD